MHQSSAVVLRTCQGKHKALHDTSKIFEKSKYDHKYPKRKKTKFKQSRHQLKSVKKDNRITSGKCARESPWTERKKFTLTLR